MALDIAQEEQGAVRVLGLRGRLDTDTSADLELAVQDLLGAGERTFLIDLSAVSYVSSAGLRVLLALAKQLEGSKGSLRLCGLNPAVSQVFDVAGFSRLFAISSDRASAVASMNKGAAVAPTPTLAQHVARILRLGDFSLPRSSQAANLARDVAQLLGVKPMPAAAGLSAPPAAVSASAAANSSSEKKPSVAGKLRGLFGGKK
jgi:anti-anti-sigma factor